MAVMHHNVCKPPINTRRRRRRHPYLTRSDLMDTDVDSGRYQRVCLPETQLDFSGQTYSVSVLKVGYCFPQADGTFRADGTITLITGLRTILVDTGGPWDRDFLLQTLKERGLEPRDIQIVVGTHGHSDHIGNLSLFPSSLTFVGYDVNEGDIYRPNKLAEGHAYSVDEYVSSHHNSHWEMAQT